MPGAREKAVLFGTVLHVSAVLCAITYLRTTKETAPEAFWIPLLLPYGGVLTFPNVLVHILAVSVSLVPALVFWFDTDQDSAYLYMLSIFLGVLAQ